MAYDPFARGGLPGDDWEAEFDSLKAGGAMYFYSLVEYVTHRIYTADADQPRLEQAWLSRLFASPSSSSTN